jgi:lauroyl/myristoyl acyltransferase
MTTGTLVMRLMRSCEAVMPPGILRMLLLPLVVPLASQDLRLREKMEAGWRCLGVPLPDKSLWFKELVRFHLVRFITFWPDRLVLPRWRQRIEFKGLEAVKALQAAGKPVVLVCLHHGPIHSLRYLLRAGGVPCAMVVLESRAERLAVREWKDSLSPPPRTPNVFCRDELKAMRRFMEQGGCLLVAADYGRGKMSESVFGPAKIQVASGAFRLAESVGAMLFPVSVQETAPWCFEVEAGMGVMPTAGESVVAEKVLAALAAKILATPVSMHSQLADSFSERTGTR